MKIAVVFPGYGSQFVGMGKELYDEHRIVQEYFEEASNCLDANFVKLCFASSDHELAKMENAFPSIFLVSCAIYALLCEKGLQAQVLAGYNQGEYAALCAGNGMSFPDGLYLFTKFDGFYKEALTSMNVSIIEVNGLSHADVEKICVQASSREHKVFVAIYRDTNAHILAGHKEAVERARDLVFVYDHATVDVLGAEYGLHSPLIDDVVNQFKIYLEKVDFKDMRVPLLNSNNNTLIVQGTQVKERVIGNINQAIRWYQVIEALNEYDTIIEIGPGNQLRDMIKNKYPDKQVIAVNQRADIEELQRIIPSMNNKTGIIMAGFDKQDTYNKVVAVIAEKLHKELPAIKGTATLQDLGADSLDMAEIVIKLEEQLNIEISDEQAEKLNTVDDVVNYVHTLRVNK